MTECAKMKLRKTDSKNSKWLNGKIFYTILFLISIITLMVNFAREREWLWTTINPQLTSLKHSFVSQTDGKTMAITNITVPLARKLVWINREESSEQQTYPETTLAFWRWNGRRNIWKPGLANSGIVEGERDRRLVEIGMVKKVETEQSKTCLSNVVVETEQSKTCRSGIV